jgi:hypothetical protein
LLSGLDPFSDISGDDKSVMLVAWRGHNAKMLGLIQLKIVYVNVVVFGTGANRIRAHEAVPNSILVARHGRMFESDNLPPAVAGQD